MNYSVTHRNKPFHIRHAQQTSALKYRTQIAVVR